VFESSFKLRFFHPAGMY